MSDSGQSHRLSGKGPVILTIVALLALLRWTLGLPSSRPQKPVHEAQPASQSQPHVTLANFRRIKLGMSVAQVDAIFGIPGEASHHAHFGRVGGVCSWVWHDGFGVVQASFDLGDDKAARASFVSKATGASFVSFAEGKQYWLEREK